MKVLLDTSVLVAAMVEHAAWKANVDQIITINDRDFRRIYPHFADKITSLDKDSDDGK